MMSMIPVTEALFYFPERFRSCNVYLLKSKDRALLVDPSLAVRDLPSDLSIQMILATHAHYDHIGALHSWKEDEPQRPFLMHAGDIGMLDDPAVNASKFFGRPGSFPHPDSSFEDGDSLTLDAQYSLQVIHTPGHTMGSSCFLIFRHQGEDKEPLALLTGDTLFDRAWGRTDFVTGDDRLMRQSLEKLHGLLSQLPADLPVCPGHASLTTAHEACRFLRMAGFAS